MDDTKNVVLDFNKEVREFMSSDNGHLLDSGYNHVFVVVISSNFIARDKNDIIDTNYFKQGIQFHSKTLRAQSSEIISVRNDEKTKENLYIARETLVVDDESLNIYFSARHAFVGVNKNYPVENTTVTLFVANRQDIVASAKQKLNVKEISLDLAYRNFNVTDLKDKVHVIGQLSLADYVNPQPNLGTGK